ncbi:hypothetical protein BP5796_08197 [Coleophoma crateriformis]|uniref:Uncharacterized protein n=1 Tax=Coleophoma crateriformis TaxID=565419 RepID=A0A3D8RDL9_9HELO|nr:hypothetical protein BP5796_08197 [Coleophoma crateriformis]
MPAPECLGQVDLVPAVGDTTSDTTDAAPQKLLNHAQRIERWLPNIRLLPSKFMPGVPEANNSQASKQLRAREQASLAPSPT